MKKLLFIVVPTLFVLMFAGAVWWRYGRSQDPSAVAQQLIDKGDLPAAQIALRNIVRTSPQNIPAHYRLGLVDLRMGDPIAAEKELRFARDAGFDPRTINPLLAQSYMAQGRYRDLLRDFSPQGLPPEEATPLLVMRALAQLSINDVAAAQTSAADAERLAPGSVDAQLVGARVALARRDITTATQKVDRALQLNPRSTDALVLKGQLLNLNGDRTRALQAFDSAIALNPKLVTARLERANVLLVSGDDKRAKQDIDAALKLEPRSGMALYLQGALLTKTNDYAAADAALTKLGGLIGRFPRGFYFQAIDKYNLGEGEQAAEAASHYLARNPTDPDAIKLFAKIELAARRSAPAIEVLNKAADAGTADSEMLDLLGRAYILAGKPELAMQSLQRAAALAPDNADILMRLAAVRMTLGDPVHASGDLEHALKLAPSQPGAGAALVVASLSAGNLDRAASALAALRHAEGDSESVGNLQALLQMAQLDLPGARKTLEDVIKRFPAAIQPRINLARVLVLLDQSAEAQRVLAEALQHDPTNATALGNMVTLLLAADQLPKAISLVEAAHAGAPKNDDITVGLVNLYIRTNAAQKALTVLADALKAHPDDLTLLDARARAQASLGQSAAARDSFRDIIALNPSDVAARRVLSDLLAGSGDYAGAKTVIADGLKVLPGNDALLQSYVAIVLRAQGLDAALAAADQLAADPANLPAARLLRGDVYMSAGKFTEAATAYSALLANGGSTAVALRLVGALDAAGRSDQAAGVLRDWLSGHPDDLQAADALASLDIAARRFYDAEAHLQLILAQQPDNADALNNLAWVYQQRGDPRALGLAQKAYLIRPTPQAADTLGWILTAHGANPAGLTLLRQAAAQLRSDPTVQYHLALALKEAGDTKEAIATLRPALQSLAEFEDRPAAESLLQQLTATK
jgi:putative PEP-CTERM system TPR-repeat lipoprotein